MSNCTNCKCEREKKIIRIELAKISPFQPDLVVTHKAGINLLKAIEMLNEVYFNGQQFTKEDIRKHNISFKVNGEVVGLDFKLKEDSFIETTDYRKAEGDDSDDKIVIKIHTIDVLDNNMDEVKFNKEDKVTVLDAYHKHMKLAVENPDTKEEMREIFNHLGAKFEFDGEEVDLDHELTRSGELKAKSNISIDELSLRQLLEVFNF